MLFNNTLKTAHVYVKCVQNNTHICFVKNSKTIFKISSGCLEKIKSKRASNIAAQKIAEEGAEFLRKFYKDTALVVYFKGFGKNRNNVIKGLLSRGMLITHIWHINNVPFNGCKARKKRRL